MSPRRRLPPWYCRFRYGRATVTVRRSARLGERIGDSPLALALDRYVSGEGDVEAVVGAFLDERIVGHSPSFDPGTADRERLLEFAVRCSEDPSFNEVSHDALVRGLLAARARDLKAIEAMNEQLSATVRHLEQQVTAALPTLPDLFGVQKMLEQQERALASVADSVGAASRVSEMVLSALPKIEPPLIPAEVLTSLSETVMPAISPELLEAMPKIAFPEVPDSLLASVAAIEALPVPDYSSLFNSLLLIDTSAYRASTYAAFRDTLAPTQLVAVPKSVIELFSRDTFRVSELLATAHEASVFAEAEGAETEAMILAEATSAAEAVTRQPTTADVLAAVHRLSERINDLDLQQRRDRRGDLARDVVMFVLSAIISYLIALHFYRLGIPPSAP